MTGLYDNLPTIPTEDIQGLVDPIPQINSLPGAGGPQTTPATLGEVDPSQTMSGQMTNIVSKDSPLLQLARTQGAQEASKRGIVNTSMGTQIGEEAVLKTALPVAQFDAARYGKVADTNKEWLNRFGQDANAFGYQSQLSEQQAGQQEDLSHQTYEQQVGAGDYAGGGVLDAKFQQDLQLQTERLMQQARLEGRSLDINEAQNMAANQLKQTQLSQELNISQQQIDQRAAEMVQQAQIQGRQLDITEAGAAAEIALQQEKIASTETMQARELEQQAAIQESREAHAEVLANMDIASRERLTNLEGASRELIQSNASAGGIYTSAMTGISNVMRTTGLSAEQQQAGVDNIIDTLEAGLRLIGGFENVTI